MRIAKNQSVYFGAGALFTLIFLILPLTMVYAQATFPSKPITLVIPWAAGGGQDNSARAISPQVGAALGQPLVIVNKPGAASATGHIFVQDADPDGYTLVQTSTPIITLQYLHPSSGVSFKKLEPIGMHAYSPAAIFVKSDGPFDTLKKLVDYAKANPGKLRLANSSNGGIWHLSGIAFAKEAQIKIVHVSTKGSAADANMVLGGHVDGMIGGPGDVFHLVKGGKLKMIAVGEPIRSKLLPDVPTFKEMGLNLVMFSYYSWLGPKGLPKEKVKIIYDALKKGADSKEYRDFCTNQAVTLSVMGPEDFAKFLAETDKKYKAFIEEGGIKAE
jgi:tripartite-type tricarboxylate transporter receptor subunit TctC